MTTSSTSLTGLLSARGGGSPAALDALVPMAYQASCERRSQVFGIAAQLMRRILSDGAAGERRVDAA